MDWKQYEKEIETYFRAEYPSARIRANVKLSGKLSQTERQIDLLIEEAIADFDFRLVIDGKYRNKKIDVKDIEEFLGLVRDVRAHKGIMISTEGYTDAAIKRAYAEGLILEVLNFKELKQYHGALAFPYRGSHGAVVQPPLGWVVDCRHGGGPLAYLYQRGSTLEEANKTRELMYMNFWSKNEPATDLDALLKHQEEYMRKHEGNPASEIHILDGVKRTDHTRTAIRIARFQKHPSLAEYTGFVDFDGFIFMCILFTTDELAEKNLGKLKFVMRKVVRVEVRHEGDTIIFDDTPKPVM